MRDRRQRAGEAGAVRLAHLGLLALALLVVLITATRRNVSALPGTTIRYDDFAFTVLGVETKPAAAKGRRLVVVSLGIDNRAKRVGYRFRDAYAILRDARGNAYPVDPVAEAAIVTGLPGGDPTASPIPAGRSAVKPLAFEVPDDARGFRLRVRPGAGNAATDALEAALFGRKEFVLP